MIAFLYIQFVGGAIVDLFNNNQGCGGFEQGSYDLEAVHPTEVNWTRQSRFNAPSSLHIVKRLSSSGLFHFTENIGSFVVDRRGRALIAVGDEDERTGKLYRVNLKEERVESLFETEGGLLSLALASDHSILVTASNRLISLDENGARQWEASIEGVPFSRPIISKEGFIYLCTFDSDRIIGRLYSFTPEGVEHWVYTCSSIFWCDPILSKEGIIYIGQNVTSKLCALTKDGNVLWEKKIGQGLGKYPPVIDSDGVIYWCLSDKLYALDSNGEVKWEYEPEEGPLVFTSPALSTDGLLYLQEVGLKMTCLTKDGQLLWKKNLKGQPFNAPVIGASGELIQSMLIDNSIDGYSVVELFTPDGDHIDSIEIGGLVESVVLADHGVVYALSAKWTRKMKAEWELVVLRAAE